MKHTGLTDWRRNSKLWNSQEHAVLIKSETGEERNSNRRNACVIYHDKDSKTHWTITYYEEETVYKDTHIHVLINVEGQDVKV